MNHVLKTIVNILMDVLSRYINFLIWLVNLNSVEFCNFYKNIY